MLPIDRVVPGQMMLVRPGERLALDGTVLDGRSDVNQAPITGESVPVEKAAGDEVFAGTINGHGALGRERHPAPRRHDAGADHPSGGGGAGRRAPMQQFIDRFAALVHAGGRRAGRGNRRRADPGRRSPVETWVYRALVVLVVACPCALVISTPVSMVSALAGAARQGVLIKGGASLERLAGVSRDRVRQDRHADPRRGRRSAPPNRSTGVESRGLLRLAAVGGAAVGTPDRAGHRRGGACTRDRVPRGRRVRALPGLGVEGDVDGARVLCARAANIQRHEALTALAPALCHA